jgi:hypothetical protein
MNIEDEIIKLQRERGLADEKFEKKLKALRKKLKKCMHKHTTSYWWESDNGYGRQSSHSSRQCRSCLKVNYWDLSDNWSDPQ